MTRSDERVLAILAFHKIGEPSEAGWDSWYYIPEKTFAEQLHKLKKNLWRCIDVGTFLRGLKDPQGLPERLALLTFDDGYKSVRDVALPWLLRFEWPAVIFVPTQFIGGRNDFDKYEEPEELICNWEDLRELERQGVSVQSLGISHQTLSGLQPAERLRELCHSKAVLEENLKKPVEVFSFPYGDDGPDPRVQAYALARSGYGAACLYGGGPVRLPASDPYRLPRIAMGPDTDLEAELQSVSGLVR